MKVLLFSYVNYFKNAPLERADDKPLFRVIVPLYPSFGGLEGSKKIFFWFLSLKFFSGGGLLNLTATASTMPAGIFGQLVSRAPPEKIICTSELSYSKWHPVMPGLSHSFARRAASSLVECAGVRPLHGLVKTGNGETERANTRPATLVVTFLINYLP